MKSGFRLGKFAPSFFKLLGAASITTVAGAIGANPAIFKDLEAIETKMIGPLFNTLASVFGNQTSDFLKDLVNRKNIGFGEDLQKVYQKAIKVTFLRLLKKSLQEYPFINPDTIYSFFKNLEDDYNGELVDTKDDVFKILYAFVHTKERFFDTVLDILQLNETEATQPEAKLLSFVAEKFPDEMRGSFLEQLLMAEHEQARLGFLIFLGEETLRIGKANENALLAVSQLLEGIVRNQQLGKLLQQEALEVQSQSKDMLRQMGYTLKGLEERIEEILRQTAPQLPLYLPKINEKDIPRKHLFQFKGMYTTFIGREAEIKKLEEFARVDDQPFRWLLITGPGGIGKSRLALEYCDKFRKEGLNAGFLKIKNLSRLQSYQPNKLTLVVVDYVAARHKKVLRAILDLYYRMSSGELSKSLRLLLIERDIKGKWWEDFEGNPEVMSCGFSVNEEKKPLLVLSAFDEEKRWKIIGEVYKKYKNEDLPYDNNSEERNEILTQLDRLDPKRRPLFAFFVGIALVYGDYANLRRWNVHNLLDSLLNRERREFWVTHKAYEKKEPKCHENLLALITLTQGLPRETILSLCEHFSVDGKWLPEDPNIDLYERMADIRQDEETRESFWEGVQPDLLGEYFVLNRFDEWIKGSLKAKKAITALISEAWELSPIETKDFIEKTLRDFQEQASSEAYQLLLSTPPSAKAQKESWNARGSLLVNGITQPFTSIDDLVIRGKYYTILAKEAEQPTELATKALAIFRQAHAAYILAKLSMESESVKFNFEYVFYFEEFHDLLTKFVFTLRQAHAINVVTHFFKTMGIKQVLQDDQKELFYDIIAREAFTDIFPMLSNVDFSLNSYINEAGDLEKAEQYYEQVTDLLIGYAKALLSLIMQFRKAGELEKAEKYYEQIIDLLNMFEAPEITLIQAKVYYNLISFFSYSGKLEKAEQCYDRIVEMLFKFKIPDIFLVQVEAANSLINYFCNAGEIEKAEKYYGMIVDVLDWHKNPFIIPWDLVNKPNIVLVQINGALLLSLSFARKMLIEKADYYFAQVYILFRKYREFNSMLHNLIVDSSGQDTLMWGSLAAELRRGNFFNINEFIQYCISLFDNNEDAPDESKELVKLYSEKLITLCDSLYL